MSVVEKGRFCGACQKKVYDFTKSSDREILATANADRNLCGNFLESQIDRPFIIQKRKSSLWLASITGTFILVLGNQQAEAQFFDQQTEVAVQTNKPPTKVVRVERIVSGDILGSAAKYNNPTIRIKGKAQETKPDNTGHFTLTASNGDILVVSCFGYCDTEITIVPEKYYYAITPDQAKIVVEAPVRTIKGKMTIVCSTITSTETMAKNHKHTLVGKLLCGFTNLFKRNENKHR